MRFRYFIRPPLVLPGDPTYSYRGCRTYSEYNYLRPGIASDIKLRHFELALRLTSGYFGKCNAIDFGCADGVFLPSLSKYFNRVLGIDRDQQLIDIASRLVTELRLSNVELLSPTSVELEKQLGKEKYQILFLLETLEHIGEGKDFWGSKVDFLREVFGLIDDRGIMVISVPKMVGLSLLVQRIGLTLLGQYTEPASLRDLFKASIFGDTTNLEKRWNGGHLGFNHRMLESHIKRQFVIRERVEDFFQVIYLVDKPGGSGRRP